MLLFSMPDGRHSTRKQNTKAMAQLDQEWYEFKDTATRRSPNEYVKNIVKWGMPAGINLDAALQRARLNVHEALHVAVLRPEIGTCVD